MNFSTGSITLLLLAAAAPAQLNFFARTQTVVSNYATDGTTPAVATIPAGTLVSAARELPSVAPGVQSGMRLRQYLTRRGFSLREYCYVASSAGSAAAGGTSVSATAMGATQAPHVFEFSIRGQSTSNLVITVVGDKTGNGNARLDLDIDNNSNIDWTHTINGTPERKIFANFAGGSPRIVRLTVDAAASKTAMGGSSYDFTVLVRLQTTVRKDAHFSRLGAPCDTMTFGGLDQGDAGNHQLLLNIEGGPANAQAFIGLGIGQTNIQLGGIPCPITVNPLLVFGVSLDANGMFQLPANLAQTLNFSAYGQAVALDPATNLGVVSNLSRIDFLD